MVVKNADRIRQFVNKKYIEPARATGQSEVSIRAGDVHRDMGLRNRMPAVCSALDAKKFEKRYMVKLKERFGPPQSSSVVWIFSILP